MDEDSAATLLQTARLAHRVGLIICATMMLVLSTHYFDTTTRTRELFDRLAMHAEEFASNNPCGYAADDVRRELQSRTRLDFDMVDIGYVGPLLPEPPTVDVFLDSQELYQPRCGHPDLVEALDAIEARLRASATSGDGRTVKGEIRIRFAADLQNFDVEIVDLHRRPGVRQYEADLAGAATQEPVSLTIPIKYETSYAEWLDARHHFDQTQLEETRTLVHRRSVQGVVQGLTFAEASKVLEALSDPEHERITLFGFSAPATAIGIMGTPVLLAYCVLLLTYLIQIKERMASEPAAIRRFPWFVTLTGRLPAALTTLSLLAPVVTAAAIFFRLGVGEGEMTMENKATAVISAICTVAMLPVLFLINETIARIRPGKDPATETAKRSGVTEVVSLARMGAALRELRAGRGMSLATLEDSFEISAKLLDDFEHGRGDLSVSYLMVVAEALDAELVLVPARRMPDGSLVGVEISITETINRIAYEDE